VSLLLHHGILSIKRLLDSHVPPPLVPEVTSQAVDLPVPLHPVVIEANNVDVESMPSTPTKSVESKIPKWLKLAQSGCHASHLSKFARSDAYLFQKNELLGAFDLKKFIIHVVYRNRNYHDT
jgi:hypothetical protein